ncbi:hypothetical protein HYFRA_00013329 [Hymenoscyphus fraxineus]|uniref:Uncharacterized protein n=1 Tax=Hymenoscyphus fraxineus TaxID=746836 RepID=A0A9N9LBZ8_9HELO|nr:hypothetical protein HYFRA_00013329 [Hymenoscyphus fraxineus]
MDISTIPLPHRTVRKGVWELGLQLPDGQGASPTVKNSHSDNIFSSTSNNSQSPSKTPKTQSHADKATQEPNPKQSSCHENPGCSYDPSTWGVYKRLSHPQTSALHTKRKGINPYGEYYPDDANPLGFLGFLRGVFYRSEGSG